ncbi:MAG: DUF4129 domain-containing protein [Treponema sp.]|jgi:hypothetical protein|nr:DUF4129 domain-containing protein [Treponema sp.]
MKFPGEAGDQTPGETGGALKDRPDRIPVTLRRRSGWEAAEMGILLWRSNWRALLLFFGIPLGLCVLGIKLLPGEFSSPAGIALWWILPLMDRLALHIVSVRFFEPHCPAGRLFRGLWKSIRRGLPGDLLWRRFSPCRSSRMPIRVLEKLEGGQFHRRKQLLTRHGLDFGFTLTLICLGLELVLGMGEMVFIFSLGQLFFPWYFTDMVTFIERGTGILAGVTWINQMLIESLYVCMGFGVYINSRVETEGWDLELLFRELAERGARSNLAPFRRISPSSLTPLLVVLIALAVVPSVPAKESAAGTEVYAPEAMDPAAAAKLEEVLDSPDFGGSKPGWEIRFKKGAEKEGDAFSGFREFPELQEIAGAALRAAAASMAAAALGVSAWLACKGRQHFLPRNRGKFRRESAPPPVEPDILLEKARVLHREGRIREAWALCLRAFIAAFARRGVVFPENATEYEALAMAGSAGDAAEPPGDAAVFALFVGRWISLAYGGRKPEEGSFEASLRDCGTLFFRTGQAGGAKI